MQSVDILRLLIDACDLRSCASVLLLTLRLSRTAQKKWQKKPSWFWKTCLQIWDLDFWRTRWIFVSLLYVIVLLIAHT